MLLCALSSLNRAFILPLQMQGSPLAQMGSSGTAEGGWGAGRAGAWLEGHPVTDTELSFQPLELCTCHEVKQPLLRETFLAQRQHWSKISHILKEALICKVSCKVIGLLPEECLRLQNKTFCLLYIYLFFAVAVCLFPVLETTARSFSFGIRIHLLLPLFPHMKSVKSKFR